MTKHIWYDLVTPNLKAAQKFYSAVVGWKIVDAGMPGMSYAIVNAGDISVGGMMQSPKGTTDPDMQPHWNGHVYVPDVDASTQQAVAAGAKICREPSDIPGIGRFAVIADPQGATLILFKPNSTETPKPVAPDTAGHIGWRELHTSDAAAAWTFYGGLFSWTKSSVFDMGQFGPYYIFATGGDDAGGIMNKMPDTPKSHWLYYFNVDGIDAAIVRVKKAKGKIVMGPHQVPTGHWIAQCTDPQGAAFALLSLKP